MRKTLIIILGFLVVNSAFGQNLDTLKVIVLSPNRVEVADNYMAEYRRLGREIIDKRLALKKQKTKAKEDNIHEYNKQPNYTKQMFENELSFYDDLTIDNYISMVVREYIAYRLFKPFKIKPRLVLVSLAKSSSSIEDYTNLARQEGTVFIINFPTMRIFKENGEVKVSTRTELFSSMTKQVLLSQENVGLAKGGLTDYPMCSGDNWDCAFVNSVYPALFDLAQLIANATAIKN